MLPKIHIAKIKVLMDNQFLKYLPKTINIEEK